MLCYFMLCYVMLCSLMLCYVMLCHVMLCYVMFSYVMLCYVMSCHVMFHTSAGAPVKRVGRNTRVLQHFRAFWCETCCRGAARPVCNVLAGVKRVACQVRRETHCVLHLGRVFRESGV